MSAPLRWPLTRPALFLLALAAELSLLLAALALGRLLDQPVWGTLEWQASAVALGAAASLPLLAFFAWTLHAAGGPLADIREFLESHARPFFGSWSGLELAAISLAAGVCEEVLFRGVLQAGLDRLFGPVLAVVLTGALFGVCHGVTRAYAVLAGLLGVYLGLLQVVSGNLLAPMVTHAIYDFVALMWLLRWRRPTSGMTESP
jgi:hypothetical protein